MRIAHILYNPKTKKYHVSETGEILSSVELGARIGRNPPKLLMLDFSDFPGEELGYELVYSRSDNAQIAYIWLFGVV